MKLIIQCVAFSESQFFYFSIRYNAHADVSVFKSFGGDNKRPHEKRRHLLDLYQPARPAAITGAQAPWMLESPHRGGATVLKVGGQIQRAKRAEILTPPPEQYVRYELSANYAPSPLPLKWGVMSPSSYGSAAHVPHASRTPYKQSPLTDLITHRTFGT